MISQGLTSTCLSFCHRKLLRPRGCRLERKRRKVKFSRLGLLYPSTDTGGKPVVCNGEEGRSPEGRHPCGCALALRSHLHRLQLLLRIHKAYSRGPLPIAATSVTAASPPQPQSVSTFCFPITWDLQGTTRGASTLLYPVITLPQVRRLQVTQRSAKRLLQRTVSFLPLTGEELNLKPGATSRARG